MLNEILRLLALEGVDPESADDIILAEIADELGLALDDVRRIMAESQ